MRGQQLGQESQSAETTAKQSKQKRRKKKGEKSLAIKKVFRADNWGLHLDNLTQEEEEEEKKIAKRERIFTDKSELWAARIVFLFFVL
jgi:hypothetical protein